MYTQLIFLFIEFIIIFGCVTWLVPFCLNKTKKDISISSFLNIFAIFLSGLVLLTTTGYALIQKSSLLPIVITFFAFVGSFFYTAFQDKKRLLFIITTLLCLLGIFLNPIAINLTLTNIITMCGATLLWVGFIYMMQQFDRVFLFSFSTFSVFFLIASLMCSDIFPFFNNSFQFLCFTTLIALISITFCLKKRGIFLQGSSFVFFLSYLIGYFGYYLGTSVNASVLPIFIAYELLEITLALGLNLYLYHQLTPIQVPFLIEKVYATQKDISKAIKKIFSISFFFSILALLSAYTIYKNISVMGLKNIYVMYAFTAVLLFQIYLIFHSWGQPKAEFKNLFKDIKSELKKVHNEFFNKKNIKK